MMKRINCSHCGKVYGTKYDIKICLFCNEEISPEMITLINIS